MPKYHVSADGNPRVCRASNGNCPIGGDETHYTSKEAARAAFEGSAKAPEWSTKKASSSESVRTIDERGVVEWRNANGELHRDGDLPAIEYLDGTKYWAQNGKWHRGGDLPAIEFPDGTKEWWVNNKRHRDNDLPAVEWMDGTKWWSQNGRLHRDGDLPAVESPDGTKEWWVYGKFQYRILPNGTRIDPL